MTKIIPQPINLPALLEEPTLPRELEHEVWQAMHPHPDVGYCPRRLPAAAVKAARAALPRYEAICQPITQEALAEWMLPLVLSTSNGPDQDGFNLRVAIILDALDGVPAGVLNAETRRSAVRTFKFFPSAPEVFELLFERGHKLKKRRWALAEICNNNAEGLL